MKLLFISKLTRFSRAIDAITKYAQVGKALGHEVAVFGEQSSEFSWLPHSLDVTKFDFAIFVVYYAGDFPNLPHLARLLDGMPKDRRVIIDCCGRYNDTIRVEHDFNHLEKLDGHQGWEWIEGFQAVSDRILQPTLKPLRTDVRSFLFHGYDPTAVARPYGSADEAAALWLDSANGAKPYGLIYVGNNWQRWSQVRRLLEAIEPLRREIGPICLTGGDWSRRPDWAIQLGLQGVDVDSALLERLAVEVRDPIPFDQFVQFTGQARFSPVFHRPLYNHLGLVTTRTFETFCCDTVPLLMLPPELVETIYGPDAHLLATGEDIAGRLQDMLRRPDAYWSAILKTRQYLTQHHAYKRRFGELAAILEG
jgi:hypothetical protein